MDMKLNAERIIRERQTKAWSQQHLAEVSGLSLRTIQRVENNGTGSLETVKSLAACFEIKVDSLYQEHQLTTDVQAKIMAKPAHKGNVRVLSFTTLLLVLACYILLKTPNSYASNINISAKEMSFNKKEAYVEYRNDVELTIAHGVTFDIKSAEQTEGTDKSMFVIKLPNGKVKARQIKIQNTDAGIIIRTDHAKYYKH